MMAYKVTAKGKLPEVKAALQDAFFGDYKITHITRPDRQGKVTLDVLSQVSITCIVEPITGIELKYKE